MIKSHYVSSKLLLSSLVAGMFVSGSAMASAPFDLNLAQPEQIIKMLQRSGKLNENATVAEGKAAYEQYIAAKKAQVIRDEVGQLDAYQTNSVKAFNKAPKKASNYVEQSAAAANKNAAVTSVQLEPWAGAKRVDHVLAILVEFPDYPHNAITPGETSNYFDDYTNDHYQQLLFSGTGYEGSDGVNTLSMKQYYEQQSGNSYSVEGSAVGWVKAKYPAAYYGNNVDGSARDLVREALDEMAKDPNFDLSYFDQEDRYDLDGDGNYREPDGLIDHLMIFHSGSGEESGGGALGEDAIWSHRWNLGGVYAIPGTDSGMGNWGGQYAAYDYTIQPIDAALGVTAHEYAHDLGLPDEYDTQYSGLGDTVSAWSIMSAGSWTGAIPGYEPTGFSTWCKEFLQAAMPGANWLHGETVHIDSLDTNGQTYVFDQANDKGTNLDYLRIDLPNKITVVNEPFEGAMSYFSGSGNDLSNFMAVEVDLTDAKTAALDFKTWYQIEQDWDYAYVVVNGQTVEGNVTTTTNPNGSNYGHGITGHSDGWVDANFDLTRYVGGKVTVQIAYITDGYVSEAGMYLDQVNVTVDGTTVVADNAEGESAFALSGFAATDGKKESEHYYLLEWRNHAGVDEGLQHVGRVISYEPGLLIWYRDTSIEDNAVGNHPGDSWIGVIDADVMPMYWSDGELASNRFQLRDATFSLTPTQSPMSFTAWTGNTVTDLYPLNYSQMADWNYYMNPWSPQSGRILQHYGMYITVEEQSADRSVGKIRVRKMW